YSHAVEQVQVCQTHISAVFLAGPFAYKVKKPVKFDFVDFNTLARRRFFCEEEVRLNRRLAGSIYHGIVPITLEGRQVRMGGEGEAIEWAVQMDRLPADRTLAALVQKGQAAPDLMGSVAQRVAAFHAKAASGAEIASFGQYDVVAGNARENVDQAAGQIGHAISANVFERLQALTEAALERLRPLIERRAGNAVPRDTHGDLRLEHVYLFPDRPPPNDLIIIDCIE